MIIIIVLLAWAKIRKCMYIYVKNKWRIVKSILLVCIDKSSREEFYNDFMIDNKYNEVFVYLF